MKTVVCGERGDRPGYVPGLSLFVARHMIKQSSGMFLINRRDIYMEQMLQVGVITQTHGVRGEVKVFPTTDDPVRFKELKHVVLDTGKETLPLEIENVKFFKQFVILKFKGYDNINDIEKYKRCPLLVEREDAVPLEEDEYFIADMIGLSVVTEDGEEFGILKDVIVTGANDVYIIDNSSYGEVLVPAIKECILDVDIEAGMMKIHLMDGLIGGCK